MQRNGGSKISEFVLLSNIILAVSVDTGNFVSQKKFNYESFQKSNLLIFPSQAVTIVTIKNIHMVFCKKQQNTLPLVCIFKCLICYLPVFFRCVVVTWYCTLGIAFWSTWNDFLIVQHYRALYCNVFFSHLVAYLLCNLWLSYLFYACFLLGGVRIILWRAASN